MAISICFGLLAATVLTLLYVPALYLIVRDVSTRLSKGRRSTQISGRRTEAG
jgi:Cu/Ag efflux pump CusA